MANFIVKGGKKLAGEYPISGAKNAAPKILIAALLTDQKCVFRNIPRISDTFRSIDTITALGGKVRFLDRNSIEIECKDIFSHEIPFESMTARQAVLFIGGGLSRNGKVKIYQPKGDAIGKRPIDRHLEGVKAFGAVVEDHGPFLEISYPNGRAKSGTYKFEKSSHSGTENLILAAVFNDGEIVIENAAQEPEVDNMIEVLNSMGAKIKRDSRTIKVEGVDFPLKGTEASAIPDRLEIATALTLAVLNGGGITVAKASDRHVGKYLEFLKAVGVELKWEGDKVEIMSVPEFLGTAEIETDPYPAFATDWQPLAGLLLAVKSKGKSSIHEKIYEGRFKYLKELSKMGVKYELFQPEGFSAEDYGFNVSEFDQENKHAAYISGGAELKSCGELESHDVRAGIDVLLAALFAEGESKILDPKGHIDRGYEYVVDKLTNLGADISRI